MTFILARTMWSESSNTFRNNIRLEQTDILRFHGDGKRRPFYRDFLNSIIAKYIPNSVPFKQYYHKVRGPSPSKPGQTYRNVPRKDASPQQYSGIAIYSTVERLRLGGPVLQTRGLETISRPASSPFPPYLAPLDRTSITALKLKYPNQQLPLLPPPVVLPAVHPGLVKHRLRYFDQEKTRYHINFAVQQKLLEPLPSAKRGWLYAFRLPDEHLVNGGSSQGYIKIGQTDAPEQRMKGIERRCKYSPQLLIALSMPGYCRLEQVVHLLLGNERMHEADGCPACRTTHQEWFEVEADRAKTMIEAWGRWAERQPYGRKGLLLAGWRRRVEGVDLTDPRCWDRFLEGL
ncbi:meiotically up-regulated gene 113-domain-containing protein [Biscogniauxia sp. FL1348]|nr:meiotically up-regulated gene 113-domain-containing protein [Biscogniauxia sp. FL1348]